MKKISEVMTTDVQTVSGDQTAREAAGFMLRAEAGSIPVCEGDKVIGIITDRDIARRMSDEQIRRLPVLDGDDRLIGIVSLGDLARETDAAPAQKALEGVSAPGGQHQQ